VSSASPEPGGDGVTPAPGDVLLEVRPLTAWGAFCAGAQTGVAIKTRTAVRADGTRETAAPISRLNAQRWHWLVIFPGVPGPVEVALLEGRLAPVVQYLPPRGVWLYNVWHSFTPPLVIAVVLALLFLVCDSTPTTLTSRYVQASST